MILLALDASTTAIGWALFIDGDLAGSNVFVPNSDVWWERIEQFGRWLDQQLSGRTEIVAYELATGHHGNVHTDRLLGAVEYEARRIARQHDLSCQFVTVTASQVRATECHKKNLAYAEAVKGGPLHEKLAGDEADAIGVGLAALKKFKLEEWERAAKPGP